MMFLIRKADIKDVDLITEISRQTFIETYAAYNSRENMDNFLDESISKDVLIKEVGAPENYFFLVFENDTPVGYMKLREGNSPGELTGINAIEIARIYAVKSSIGKGVGKLMIQECINIAVSKKKELIWLGVWEHNKRAFDFYTKWGFEKFSSYVFKLGNENQTDWLMRKILH